MNSEHRPLWCAVLTAVGWFVGVVILLTLVAVAYSGEPCAPCCCKPANTVDQCIVKPYVEVRLNPDQSCGSGIVVEIQGEKLVLTAGHVVQTARKNVKREYTNKEGEEVIAYPLVWQPVYLYKKYHGVEWTRKAQVVWYSAPEEAGGDDLALLKPESDDGLVAASMNLDYKPEVGQEIWLIGTGGGFHQNLDRTIIAVPDHESWGKPFVAFQGSTWFGHSGGGVFVKNGNGYVLFGVITRGVNPDENPKCPALAEHPQTVKKFIADYIRSKTEKKETSQP